MNNATAYFAIKAHFEQPGARLSSDGNGNCYYRCPYDHPNHGNTDLAPREGEKCPMGVLIPDDVYEIVGEDIESRSASEAAAIIERRCHTGLFDEVDLDFIDEVQGRHDTAVSVKQFLVGLDCLADNFNALAS